MRDIPLQSAGDHDPRIIMYQLIGAALAAGTAVLVDLYIKETTGKHIHEHIYQWWCEIRDTISDWLNQFSYLPIRKIGLLILDSFDGFAVRTKHMADRITLGIYAEDANGNNYEVTSVRELSTDEVLKQFPEFSQCSLLVQEVST
jgi:hypothetical protein